MSGWILPVLLALLTAGALILIARRKQVGMAAIAIAVIFGLAGYMWQGSPALPGSLPPPKAATRGVETFFSLERKVWLESVGPDAVQLDGADAFIRNGDADYAAGVLRAGLMRNPDDMVLWIGLGNALQMHADGVVTPTARYAFERAAAIAPTHPAPRYFLGLAYLQMRDVDSAVAIWRDLIAHSPPDAPWRSRVETQLALIERYKSAS